MNDLIYSCRQFGRDALLSVIKTKELIDKLLLEKLPLVGTAGVADVSEPWLEGYVN